VLKFDLAGALPAGAVVNGVTLTLNMSRTVAGFTSVSLHPLSQDWGEGTSHASGNEGGGATATAGDATWVHTFFNTSSWATIGGDFAPAASATLLINAVGPYDFGSTAAMVADVEGWRSAPASNFGWILIGDESVTNTAKRFDSRSHPTSANRPRLTIDFSLPGAVPTLSGWGSAALIAALAGGALLALRRR
jgi:hypothetical protein